MHIFGKKKSHPISMTAAGLRVLTDLHNFWNALPKESDKHLVSFPGHLSLHLLPQRMFLHALPLHALDLQ